MLNPKAFCQAFFSLEVKPKLSTNWLGLSVIEELRSYAMPASPVFHGTSPFVRFAKRHFATNCWFRSTEIAYMVVSLLAKERDPADLAQRLIPKTDRWDFTFQKYYSRASKEGRRSKATVADLLKDLRDGRDELIEATIVKEVGALKIFLREWSIEALNAAIAPGSVSLSLNNQQRMREALDSLMAKPYESVSLVRIGDLFPTLRAVLTRSTHLRALRPLLAPGSEDLTCQSVAGLWREVRNLLLHHNAIVHSRFASNYGRVWGSLHRNARERGSTVRALSPRVGRRLPIDTRHAIFCFTSCYQTAVVLHIATGADGAGQSQHLEA